MGKLGAESTIHKFCLRIVCDYISSREIFLGINRFRFKEEF